MERFFILDKHNTWYDWRLILTAKDVTPPEPKYNYVDIDGVSGTIDLSESLSGEVVYKDRTITASFWTNEGTIGDRDKLLRKIIATLHGKKIKIIEPDDPSHYFYGRVKVKSQKNNLSYAEFTIEATCDPWRYCICDTVRMVEVNGDIMTKVVIRNNGVKTLCPSLTVNGSVKMIHNGVTTTLNAGFWKLPDIKLKQGVNIVEVSGNGSVAFSYKEADL